MHRYLRSGRGREGCAPASSRDFNHLRARPFLLPGGEKNARRNLEIHATATHADSCPVLPPQMPFAARLCQFDLLLPVAEPLAVVFAALVVTARAGYTFLEFG